MRGPDVQRSSEKFTASPDDLVPPDHPLRTVKAMADEVLTEMSPHFETIYSLAGRPSIPPERLLRAQLLQLLYSVRSERLLVEQLGYNMLFRWFVGMSGIEPVWDASTYTKNRERFIAGAVADAFFQRVVAKADAAGLMSDEHFSVDGTLLEAWASHKSFKPKDGGGDDPPPDDPGNADVDFKGQKRSNATHASTSDPDARLYKKSKGEGAKMAYLGNVLTENRNGMVAAVKATLATGTAEREAALDLIARAGGSNTQRLTLGADKGYDTKDFVAALRELEVTPHVAQNDTNRRSAIDGRTTRHAGYEVSQRKRKLVEEFNGWVKTVGGLRKLRHRGLARVDWMLTFAAAAYNLVRMRTLLPA